MPEMKVREMLREIEQQGWVYAYTEGDHHHFRHRSAKDKRWSPASRALRCQPSWWPASASKPAAANRRSLSVNRTSPVVRPAVEIVLEDAGENWGAHAPGVPGVIAIGSTEETCRESTESALAAHLRFVAKEDAEELARLAAEVERELEARV